jgi:thiamine-monophosphate kinase
MSENLNQIGEKQFLQTVKKHLKTDQDIVRVFSEDCAVINQDKNFYQLFTVDSLVEGVHFQREYMPGFLLGRKALTVNLSDIGAMGGTPQFYLLSLGAPPNTPVQLIDDIYQGMAATAQEYGVRLIGGNVTSSAQLFLDITMIGRVKKAHLVRRDGANRGDVLFVTGQLGGSAEGLNLLREGFRLIGNGLILPEGQRDSNHAMEAIQIHLNPACSVRLGDQLAKTRMITSMIDLSDGIASDLSEIARESRVGARIDLEKVPVAPSVLYWERKRNRDPRILALFGGEDYHLLFTVSKKEKLKFLTRMEKENITVYEIGRIVSRTQGVFAVDREGGSFALDHGFQHFRS